jgi:hypothetical protein
MDASVPRLAETRSASNAGADSGRVQPGKSLAVTEAISVYEHRL